jgi:hypothetical protein
MQCGHGVGEATRGAYNTVRRTAEDLYVDILPAVKATVDALDKFNAAITHITVITVSATNLLRVCDIERPVDPRNEMVEGLEQAEGSLRAGVEILRKKRGAAEADHKLLGDDERQVLSAYERAIVTLSGLHDAVVEFRWVIMEHDADLESPVGPATDSPREILRSALN